MKICLINNLYKPLNVGGAEKVVENIAKIFADLGHDVRVMTIGFNEAGEVVDDGYKVVRLENKFCYHRYITNNQSIFKKLYWHWQNIFSHSHADQAEEYFKSWQPDIVWTHNLSGFGWQIVKVPRKLKIRHWHELHDFQLIDPFGTYFRSNLVKQILFPILFYIYSRISFLVFKSPDIVIGPSKFIVDFHRKFGFFKQSKLINHPNPLNKDFSFTQIISTSLPVKFLFIGQVEIHKGVKVLVDVFNKLIDYNCSLDFVGVGDYLEQAKLSNKNSQVNFCGQLTSVEVAKKLDKSAVLIIPSIWPENSPTVIAEALTLGRPVLGSRIGGIPEMVNNGYNGWLVEPVSVDDWVVAIKNIVDNPEQLKQFSEHAKISAEVYSVVEYKNWLGKII